MESLNNHPILSFSNDSNFLTFKFLTKENKIPFDLEDTDVISQQTYSEHLDQQKKHQCPYVLAIIQELSGKHYAYDGESLHRWAVDHHTNPCTRQSIQEIFYFKLKSLSSKSPTFKYLGGFSESEKKTDAGKKKIQFFNHFFAAHQIIEETNLPNPSLSDLRKLKTSALYDLGCCYENAEGTANNLSKAIKCYKEAAKNGHDQATVVLGNCYRTGNGVKKNPEKAALHYALAAKTSKEAQLNLAICYEKGIGTKQNYKLALAYYELAAQ